MRSLPWPVAAGSLAAVLLSGCSLGNINPDECESHQACEATFGLGSECEDSGYCSDAFECPSSVQCRSRFGYGTTCEDSVCVVAPLEPRCTLSQPPELLGQLPGRITDRILIGGLFALDTIKHAVRADATRLAVQQINQNAAGIRGVPLGLLICNNDSDGDTANNTQEVQELTQYLAGTLGVPVILGPTASSASLTATNTVIQSGLATALISPSATSPQLTDMVDRLSPGDPYGMFWRTCPSDALQGSVLARVIAGGIDGVTVPPGLTRVAVLHQNDAYGTGLQQVFRDAFVAGEVSAFSFEVDLSNVATAVGNAAGWAPNAVLLISSDAERTVQVLDAAMAAGGAMQVPYFLTDGSKDGSVLLSSSNSALVQQIVRAVIGTAPASPTGGAYDSFRDALAGTPFQRDASQYSFVAHSYDAAFVGAYGIAFGSNLSPEFDGRFVADGMSRLAFGDSVTIGPNDFQTAVSVLSTADGQIDILGTSGTLNFDSATGEAPGDVEIWAVCEPGVDAGCTGTPEPGTTLVFNTLTTVAP